MSQVKFMKWHGAGNDFVVIDSRQGDAMMTKELAARLGDRHRGVGFDQLAEIRESNLADIALDFWNSDGSRAGACGNATRCVARYLMDQGDTSEVTIQTERGILQAVLIDNEVWVNMGHPLLDWRDVPLATAVDTASLPINGSPVAVGMGNPHCVFFVDDINEIALEEMGSSHEHHPLFPAATNVEFAQIISSSEIRLRVWERGAGVTLACGSGACATLVAAVGRSLTQKRVRMELDGGWLTIDWRDDGVWMSGPTAFVFDAVLSDEFVRDVK